MKIRITAKILFKKVKRSAIVKSNKYLFSQQVKKMQADKEFLHRILVLLLIFLRNKNIKS